MTAPSTTSSNSQNTTMNSLQQTPTTATQSSSSKKTVRFQEDEPPTVLLIEEICELPVLDIWFTADDYFDMKAKTRYDAKEWRKKGFGLLLKETFENPADTAQEYLNAFCMLDVDMSRRGMERHLSRKHGEERSDVKDRARYCVLSAQRRMRRQGMKPAELQDHLALIYHDATRPAKIFARRIAKADELAARNESDNTLALDILDQMGVGPRSGRMERRLSNLSIRSGSTYDSIKSWGSAKYGFGTHREVNDPLGRAAPPPPSLGKARCPGSPATAMEECYAAMA